MAKANKIIEKKKGSKSSKYAKKLAHRKVEARKFGSLGFYTISGGKNKGKRVPLPLPILKQARVVIEEIEIEEEIEETGETK